MGGAEEEESEEECPDPVVTVEWLVADEFAEW